MAMHPLWMKATYNHLIYLTSDFSKARPLARPLEIYGNIWKNYGKTMQKLSQDDPRMIPRGSQNDPKTFWIYFLSKYCFWGNIFPKYCFGEKANFDKTRISKHVVRYFAKVLLPKWPWEPCDHFMVLVKKALYDGKYQSILHFWRGPPIFRITV